MFNPDSLGGIAAKASIERHQLVAAREHADSPVAVLEFRETAVRVSAMDPFPPTQMPSRKCEA